MSAFAGPRARCSAPAWGGPGGGGPPPRPAPPPPPAAGGVRCVQIPMSAFTERLAGSGMSPAIIDGYGEMMTAKNEGLDNAEPRTSENTTPTGFRDWCEQYLKPAVLG